MGSLSSTPKAPQQQVVFVPATASPPEEPQISAAQESAARAAENRTKSLLSRNRGRFGTIATSLQGFLNDKIFSGRKTLLGE